MNQTPTIALIGGTGLNTLPGLSIASLEQIDTPYGRPSSTITRGLWRGHNLLFIARHGDGHTIPPHLVNYRANIHALKTAGATHIIGINAVGSIDQTFTPGTLCIPHDIIDYTYGREHTYADGTASTVQHIEFAPPYDKELRQSLCNAINNDVPLLTTGVHGVTQGPRLETAAEITRMTRDGCTLVGMTGMPEAALARELELPYACVAVSVNWAAGKSPTKTGIHDEIEQWISLGMANVLALLEHAIPTI